MIDVNATDLRRVVGLACLTEDRTKDEQKALLECAFKLDAASMKLTVTNRDPKLSNVVADVLSTVDGDSDGGSVRLSDLQYRRHVQMVDRLRDEMARQDAIKADAAIARGALRPDEA